jgi:hypothetical protein
LNLLFSGKSYKKEIFKVKNSIGSLAGQSSNLSVFFRVQRREEARQSDSQPEVSTPTDLSLDKRSYRRDFSPGNNSTHLQLDPRGYRFAPDIGKLEFFKSYFSMG